MRRALLLCCAVALLAVPAAAADPPQSGVTHVHVARGTSPVDWGEQLFGANCVTCHGPNGGGITSPVHGAGDEEGLGPSLRGVGARSADFYLRTGRGRGSRSRIRGAEISLTGSSCSPSTAPGAIRSMRRGAM